MAESSFIGEEIIINRDFIPQWKYSDYFLLLLLLF